MKFSKEKLRESCTKVAEQCLWQKEHDPEDFIDIGKLSEMFFDIAIDKLEDIREFGCNKNILIYAVDYLGHTHAIPPMEENIQWFSDMLDCVIELCCPNTIQNKNSAMIFEYIITGIENSIKNISNEAEF